MKKVNFTITTEDVKDICNREGLKSMDQKDFETILKDVKRIYELNIKQEIGEYIYGQAFNHYNKLIKKQWQKDNKEYYKVGIEGWWTQTPPADNIMDNNIKILKNSIKNKKK
tara:strand:- start:7491 stop:7826 length:336 start_codon:yes stop_codon:yes gene_type:complete